MRFGAFVIMASLAVLSFAEGHIALGLVFGGIKALLVGLGYMELSRAARPHVVAYVGFVTALTTVLVAIVGT